MSTSPPCSGSHAFAGRFNLTAGCPILSCEQRFCAFPLFFSLLLLLDLYGVLWCTIPSLRAEFSWAQAFLFQLSVTVLWSCGTTLFGLERRVFFLLIFSISGAGSLLERLVDVSTYRKASDVVGVDRLVIFPLFFGFILWIERDEIGVYFLPPFLASPTAKRYIADNLGFGY